MLLRRIFILLVISCSLCLPAFAKTDQQVSLITVPDDGSGVVFFRIMVKAGSKHDPQGKEGLAYFTSILLQRGTKSLDRESIEAELDAIGAWFDVKVERDFTLISGKCLKKTVDRFYYILRDLLTQPTFPEQQVRSTRDDQLSAIEAIINDNHDLGLRAFDYFLNKGTPLAHSFVGRRDTVAKLSHEDAKNFYGTYYNAANMHVGVGGDFKDVRVLNQQKKSVPLKQALEEDLKLLGFKTVPTLAKEKMVKDTGRRALIVEKPGVAQGQIHIGNHIAFDRNDTVFPAAYLLSKSLGAHREQLGVLFQEVRERRGLTYGAYAYVEFFPYPYSGSGKLPDLNVARLQQDFRIWTFTVTKNMNFTTRLMLWHLEKLIKDSFSKERFTRVKQFLINRFVFEVETAERRLAMKLDDLLYSDADHSKHQFDFAQTFPKRLAALKFGQLKQAGQALTDLNNLSMVFVVADANAFKVELLSDTATIEYQGKIDPKPLAAEDAKVKQLDLGFKPEKIQVVTIEELFGPA